MRTNTNRIKNKTVYNIKWHVISNIYICALIIFKLSLQRSKEISLYSREHLSQRERERERGHISREMNK